MGFWRELSGAFDKTHGDVSNIIGGPVNEGAGMVGKAVGKTMGGVGSVVGGTAGVVTGTVSGIMGPLKKPAKIGAIIVAAGTLLGVAAHYLRKPRKMDRPIEPMADMLPPPVMGMEAMPQNTMMGMTPVEGPQVARVQQSRQAGVAGPGIGA